MPGGLLNLVSYGNQNVILNGNPTKTFFKCTYAKYTNFGIQRFRLDYEGLNGLNLTTSSKYVFKVKRYADLLLDSYLVISLPPIWSPIIPPNGDIKDWSEYGFKWIKNLGTSIIQRVKYTVGGQLIQQYDGDYLYNLVQRDFNNCKKDLFNKMTGNIPEFNDPANFANRNGGYPNAIATQNSIGVDPSINPRQIFIPLNTWFSLASKMAFPLVSMQYNQLHIEIELRAIEDIFVIKNIPQTIDDNTDYRKPNFTLDSDKFYKFLQPPLWDAKEYNNWTNKRTNWNSDIHILANYVFLSEDEVKVFASNSQQYLIKEIYQHTHNNLYGPSRVELRNTGGMVSSWMWYFRRSDAYLRNEWTNYSNWKYENIIPNGLLNPIQVIKKFPQDYATGDNKNKLYPGVNENLVVSLNSFSPLYSVQNTEDIMTLWGLLLDGKYRENIFSAGVNNYLEKYIFTNGNAKDGLYCYNFSLNTDPFDFQPSGAMNLSKFNRIEWEIDVIKPPLDSNAKVSTICDASGNLIGVNKPVWNIYEYTYDLFITEERYNILTFSSGMVSLMYAR